MQDATVTMAFGRRYGLVGRNGTGKTTLLRAMAYHQIKGIPENCQILHVEQEVGRIMLPTATDQCCDHIFTVLSQLRIPMIIFESLNCRHVTDMATISGMWGQS